MSPMTMAVLIMVGFVLVLLFGEWISPSPRRRGWRK
jgi:hypothetical protein